MRHAIARLACVCASFLLLAGGAGEARAQGETSGPSTQIWADLIAGKTKGERLYLQLDVEPKWQVTSGEEWRAFYLTPLVEHYPADWLDLEAAAAIGHTRQREGLDTFEITPRVGARSHLFARMATHRPGIPGLEHERLPLTRLGVSTLVRLEWRNLFYSDDTPDQHQWRARLRLEGKLAVNHAKLSEDRTLYASADAEYYLPLGDDVQERYVNKTRVRTGLGFRFSRATRLELLYIRDWNRSSSDATAAENSQALDLRVKLLF